MTAETITRLNQELDTQLADLLPHGTRFALLDYPDYANVGDNAIYLGATRFFARAGLRPAFSCIPAKTDWDALRTTIGPGPIFLSGGGNFGDLYDWAQDYREDVLRRFPGRPVIQLPQTIHFRSPARLDQAARAIERHGAFVLCVRDRQSLELAQRHLPCDVRLCPDMAFALGPLTRSAPRHPLLLLLRQDDEGSIDHAAGLALPPEAVLTDWPVDPEQFHARTRRAALPAAVLATRHGRWAGRARVLQGLAAERVRRGSALLSTGRMVITDRLHGHILCTLLGIPHAFLDNRYGKIDSFSSTWATQSSAAVAASSLSHALAICAGARTAGAAGPDCLSASR